jgi:hypothetical protein
MLLPTVAKAEEEKRRLERLGYMVTAVVPPGDDTVEPTVSASPI